MSALKNMDSSGHVFSKKIIGSISLHFAAKMTEADASSSSSPPSIIFVKQEYISVKLAHRSGRPLHLGLPIVSQAPSRFVCRSEIFTKDGETRGRDAAADFQFPRHFSTQVGAQFSAERAKREATIGSRYISVVATVAKPCLFVSIPKATKRNSSFSRFAGVLRDVRDAPLFPSTD